MSEAVARGRIYAPGFFQNPAIPRRVSRREWLGPSQGQLDPVKEITAEILACSEGFSTHEQSTTASTVANGTATWNSSDVKMKSSEAIRQIRTRAAPEQRNRTANRIRQKATTIRTTLKQLARGARWLSAAS